MSKAAELAALIGSQTAQGNRNLVINGAMQIWQRGTSIDTISNNGFLCDRWKIQHGGTDGNVDIDRTTDVPDGKGFGFSQKVSMDASESSLDAADSIRVVQRMEGQNLQSLKKGTSSAESVTISFYVKSSVAATYTVNIRDEDNDRDNAKTYTINSVNTWEFKSITFAGDTTGALDNDNSRSFDLNFWIDAGTNFTSGTFYNGTWAAGDNTKKVSATTGWLQSSSPTWFITGVQMELGEQATAFEHRSFADDLALCQRYFYKILGTGDSFSPLSGGGVLRSTTQGDVPTTFPVAMRTAPTFAESSAQLCSENGSDVTSLGNNRSNAFMGQQEATASGLSGGDAGEACYLRCNNDASAFVSYDAEL